MSLDTEALPLRTFAERAYLDYSMYVILDRALPHVADGLKPVQRRIVYAMSELGLAAGSKPKKSARTVGDVIGKFHPHGDSACYEAMVLMAQDFSYRYPLIEGQGNWGSADDPKSFAAMRYTESRLTPYSRLLLAELGQGTVDFRPNFDGTLEEPQLLPARLPNLLLNGAHGIAVGMATDIPPHNLREVAAALVHLIDHPDADTAALAEHLPGPDFPTGCDIVSSRADLLTLYETGAGSVRARARYEAEDGQIVITALPYQTSGARVLEQIAAQMQAKKLPWLEDLRDESDHENPVRLVLVPRSRRVDAGPLMDHLYATTELERSYRVSLNCIGLDGRPAVRPLVPLLREWLEFRTVTVRRRVQHRLTRVLDRLHLLDGLLIALLNIDEVIHIIRTQEDPKAALIARFGLSDAQAEAILELRLRHLARLEEMRLKAEQAELAAERDRLEALLASPKKLTAQIRAEIVEDARVHGDARRCLLIERSAARALAAAELTPAEPVTVVLSAHGWVRLAKGHEVAADTLSYRTGDRLFTAARGRSSDQAVFLDSTGRTYSVPASALPSARGHGEPLSGRADLPPGARALALLLGAGPEAWVLGSDAGYGFLARTEALVSRNRAGKAVLTLPEGAVPLAPVRVPHDTPAPHGAAALACVSTDGHLLVCALDELPELPRGKGVKLLALRDGARVAALAVLAPGQALRVLSGERHLTLRGSDLDAYRGPRARRGRPLPRGFARVRGLLAED